MYLWIWPATGRGVSLSGTSSPIANIVTSQLPTFEWPPPSYWLPGLACESSGWGGSWEEHDPLKWTNHAEDNQTLWGTNESWRKVSASDNRMQTTSSTLLNIFEQFFFSEELDLQSSMSLLWYLKDPRGRNLSVRADSASAREEELEQRLEGGFAKKNYWQSHRWLFCF